MAATCEVTGCDRPVRTRGRCSPCYQRLRRQERNPGIVQRHMWTPEEDAAVLAAVSTPPSERRWRAATGPTEMQRLAEKIGVTERCIYARRGWLLGFH